MAGRTGSIGWGSPSWFVSEFGAYDQLPMAGCLFAQGPVAVPGTFLLEARSNPVIGGEDVIQVCILELSGGPGNSITSLAIRSFRTTDEALPFCRASAPWAFSQWRGRTGLETPRGILPIVGTPVVVVGSASARGVLGSRQFRSRPDRARDLTAGGRPHRGGEASCTLGESGFGTQPTSPEVLPFPKCEQCLDRAPPSRLLFLEGSLTGLAMDVEATKEPDRR